MEYKHIEDVILSYSKFGVETEYVDVDNIIHISVPKDSYIKDTDGNPICGESLAKQFSYENMKLFGPKKMPKLLFNIRDEYWTRELEEEYVMKCMVTALKIKRSKNNR